jgi:predicted nucleic acid-binding protein
MAMLEVVIRHDHIVLDACCIINIAATGELDHILEAIPPRFVVSSYVMKREVLTFINTSGGEIPINLTETVAKGLILEADIDYSNESDANLIVALEASNLDTGEAESAAIAINRNWAIATDDKRAIKVITQAAPKIQILTTPELIKCWVDKLSVPDHRVRKAVQSIRRYTPPITHPLFNWWKSYL